MCFAKVASAAATWFDEFLKTIPFQKKSKGFPGQHYINPFYNAPTASKSAVPLKPEENTEEKAEEEEKPEEENPRRQRANSIDTDSENEPDQQLTI